MYDPKNHIGKYSNNELKKLQDLRGQYGNDWQKIGQALGRSAASIKDRCRHLKEDCNTGSQKVSFFYQQFAFNIFFILKDLGLQQKKIVYVKPYSH